MLIKEKYNRTIIFLIVLFCASIFLIIKDSKISHESGLYLKPFKLKLENNKDTIRYTLDGSNPTNKSKLLEKEIYIDPYINKNYLSYIQTTIPDSIAKFGWRKPLGEQRKAAVLKYAKFKNNKITSKIKTLTFFIDSNLYKKTYPPTIKNNILNTINLKYLNTFIKKDSIITTKYNLPIISISTDKENLYGYEKGLFVCGKEFNPKNKHSGNYFKNVNYISIGGEVKIDSKHSSLVTKLIAQSSYKSISGDQDAKGDGLVPLSSSILKGSQKIILPETFHGGIFGKVWYGTPSKVEEWWKQIIWK